MGKRTGDDEAALSVSPQLFDDAESFAALMEA